LFAEDFGMKYKSFFLEVLIPYNILYALNKSFAPELGKGKWRLHFLPFVKWQGDRGVLFIA
jgi:hypothetical protein